MAYLNRLTSVPRDQVAALQDDPDAVIGPTLSVFVSHLIAYWVQTQPIGGLLGRAVDGGNVISPVLRHKFRNPCFHEPDAVRLLTDQLRAAWEEAFLAEPLPPDDWYRIEIEKVLRLFTHAADRSECVVSTIEPCNVIHFAPST